jgi:hypothetical protein
MRENICEEIAGLSRTPRFDANRNLKPPEHIRQKPLLLSTTEIVQHSNVAIRATPSHAPPALHS